MTQGYYLNWHATAHGSRAVKRKLKGSPPLVSGRMDHMVSFSFFNEDGQIMRFTIPTEHAKSMLYTLDKIINKTP